MEKIQKYFQENIKATRWEHSLRVLEIAEKLASIYDVDAEKTRLAALLHDCGKFSDSSILLKKAKAFDIILDNILINNLELIHGPLGAKIAEKQFHIVDSDILNAIRYHTTARKNMTILEKVIFIADYIEPERSFQGVNEVRELAFHNINKAMVLAIDNTINFLIANKKLIAVDAIEARNDIILEISKGRRE